MNILTFTEKRPALAFSDYLRSVGIANRVEKTDAGFAIHLEQEADRDRAIAEAQAFVTNPDDPKFWQASWQTGAVQKEAVYADTVRENWLATWWQRGGWVTRIVTLFCVLVYIAELIGGDAVIKALGYADGISLVALQGEWWRLVTPAFVHFSVIHIVFNILWWWELGGLVEKEQSSWRLLALTAVIILVSNAAQFLSYGSGFGGLSAVVYGLLGYLWLYPLLDPNAGFRLRNSIVIFMLGWLALGYTGIFDAIFGPISNNGHLAGLLVGCALGVLLALINYKKAAVEE
ncbi:MAG: rhomboid family intramembrane serine protease GlpG [Moraxellaceae bacterium]